MRGNRFKYVLLIVFLVLAGIAVYFFTHKKEALKFVLPEITKVTLIKARIFKDTAYIDVFAIAKNNSPYVINIDSILCDLSIGKVLLISEKQRYDLRQEKNQSDTIKLSVKVPVAHTRKTIQDLQSQDSTGLTFDATVVYNTVAGRKRIHINKDKRIEVPVPPQIKLHSERKELKLLKKDLKVDLFMDLTNEGKNLDLDISGLQYELVLGKDLYTKGKYPKKIVVNPQSRETIIFPLDFDMNTPVATILKVWTDNDSVPFKITLSGFVDAKKVHHIPVIIIGYGKMELVKPKTEKEKKQHENYKEMQKKEKKKN